MEGYMACVTMFAGNFAPRNWQYCAGQLVAIANNTALFSLLGTMYGGDGRVTFGLPDLRGRVVVGQGQGAGLSDYTQGEMSGTETNTLLSSNLPQHNHVAVVTAKMQVNGNNSTTDNPEAAYFGTATSNIYNNANSGQYMGPLHTVATVGVTGSNVPMNNIQPSLGMNYIICMYGIFPSRN